MAAPSAAKHDSPCQNAHQLSSNDLPTVWHKSAPQEVRRAFSSGDDSGGWTAWRRHLAKRKSPADTSELLPGKTEPLGWALPDGCDSLPVPSWMVEAGRVRAEGQPPDAGLEGEVFRWLEESAAATPGSPYALELLAVAWALPRLAEALTAEAWWALLDHLLSAVSDAAAIELDDHPLAHQLLVGELALTLACLLPEITPCRRLKSTARRAISDGLIDLLDGGGMPHAKHLALMRPLLACWTRCQGLGQRLKGGCLTTAAGQQYEWLVLQALRLTRQDGTPALSNGAAARWDNALFEAALRLDDDQLDRRVAAVVLPSNEKSGKKDGRRQVDGLPEPAVHSEWAATAVLRPQWSRSGERLTVVYAGQTVQMELACGKDVLWSGEWELEINVGGRQILPDCEWEEVCWISDDDADYLELEISLGDGLRVQRQMLLARQDHFLLLADAVLGDGNIKDEARMFDYRGCLPLGPGIRFRPADETRDGSLGGSKRRALVLPLALPEWRADRRIGELTQTARGLELCQMSAGPHLYAPLFFDLDRRRQTRRLTWRQLTVAESLVIQPAEVAAGYRVAVANEQWLIYRSLAAKANRTLLGHNLSTEMLVARFDRSGEVEPLIEIE